MSQNQFGRSAKLLVVRPEALDGTPASIIDLSSTHFRFRTVQQDVESPNNCSIRVYNLSNATVEAITKTEYSRVVLQAGYEGSGTGKIFEGTIKWFKVGRESATDKYLDILAADGDLAYNFAVVNQTLAAGSTPKQRVDAVISEMAKKGAVSGEVMDMTGGVLPRGKVLFGMARALLRQEVEAQGATWHIEGGRVHVTPLTGYRAGEAVVLSALTGLVGLPEQTNEGLLAKCLLNPRIVVGGLVKIDNKTINQMLQQNPNAAPVAFNSYTGLQLLATVAADGLYRVFVAEHEGDTRGAQWHTHLTCLAVNPSTKQVKAYG
jgi:hypothetical protein